MLQLSDALNAHPPGQPQPIWFGQVEHEAEGYGIRKYQEHNTEEKRVGRGHEVSANNPFLARMEQHAVCMKEFRSTRPEHQECPKHCAGRSEEHEKTK